MSKKALCNLATGEVIIEKGKIYSDESVANLDPTNFEDCTDEVNTEPRGGVVGEEVVAPSAKPEFDTEEEVSDETIDEDQEKKSEDEDSSVSSEDNEEDTSHIPDAEIEEEVEE